MRRAIVLTTAAALAIAAVLAAAAVAQSAEPTKTGDIIGSVTMLPDRSLHMRLYSVQCDGTIAEGSLDMKPTQPNYQATIDHVGGLEPDETKPVPAWPTPPCPAN
jgi:hypothetical protein